MSELDIQIEVSLEIPDIEINVQSGGEYYPEYDGEYEFTPAAEEQVIQTRQKVLLDNIRIAPIPQNYGLITYRGHTITVS